MKQPFFSIVIPTYNRADSLKCAINSFLAQNFGDFEIIVSDNNSTDNTRKVVESFGEKRIVYSKNSENVGSLSNIQKVILMAQGKYIITHGDDDVILFSNSLRRVYNLINEKNCGFIRLNYLSKDRWNTKISNIYIDQSSDLYIPKNTKPLSLIGFLENIHTEFISGLIFKNENIAQDNFIFSDISTLIKILFRLSEKYGSAFMSDNYIIASWSEGDLSRVYTIDENNRLYFENYYDCVTKELLNKMEADEYKKLYFQRLGNTFIYFFPALKYFGNNKILKSYKNRLCYLNKSFKNDFSFWFYYYLSFYAPKLVISFIRKYIQFIRSDSIKDIKDIKGIDDIRKKYRKLTQTI